MMSDAIEFEDALYDCNKEEDLRDRKGHESIITRNSEIIFDKPNRISALSNTNYMEHSVDTIDLENNINVPVDVTQNRKRSRSGSKKFAVSRESAESFEQEEKTIQQTENKRMRSTSSSKRKPGSKQLYLLSISNLPKSWTVLNIKKFIETQTKCAIGPMALMESSEDFVNIQLKFNSYHECKQVIDCLHDKDAEGTKLCVRLEGDFDPDLSSDSTEDDVAVQLGTENLSVTNDTMPHQPDMDVWAVDPQGLYGLKREFLRSLDIEPPIDKWIQVTNFRCDKSELRDILEMAGQVLMCTVLTVSTQKCAKVMYSHPLEAVQAVSMFNGQTFYGQTLKLRMERRPNDTTILPKGLAGIGLGFGKHGKPLRNIVEHYRRIKNNDYSSVNILLFNDCKDITPATTTSVQQENVDENLFGSVTMKTMNVTELFDSEKGGKDADASTPAEEKVLPKDLSSIIDKKPLKNNVVQSNIAKTSPGPPGPLNATKPLLANTASYVNPILASTLTRPSFPPEIVPRAPFRAVMNPVRPNIPCRPMPAVNPGPVFLGQPDVPMSFVRPSIHPVGLRPSLSVKLSNLPLTTTFPLLYERVSACGQITSLQFTTPGCAIATFASPPQAEMCINKFNRLNVEGQVISAAFL